MDYEKKYKKALERAATELETCGANESLRNMIYAIFPDELKESEDERIRKECISIINAWAEACRVEGDCCEVAPICIAWLEKQGEQKVSVVDFNAKDWYVSKVDGKIHDMTYNPVDKVEPKFEDEIEIPFGAKDSELQEETYYIPKGFHAEIEADKVVIKKGEKPAAWSDEDDAYKEFVISAVEDFYDEKNPLQKTLIDWLKSLKDRIGG